MTEDSRTAQVMTKSYSKVLVIKEEDYWSMCLAYSPVLLSLQSVFCNHLLISENCLVNPSLV